MAQKNAIKCDQLSHPFISLLTPKRKVSITFEGPGLTRQSFKDECDINRIMSTYQRTGQLPPGYDPTAGQYLDVTGHDFQAAQQLIADARAMFQALPATLRARYGNDPATFLDAVNSADDAELARMGLKRAEATPPASNEAGKGGDTPPPAKPAPTPLPASGEGSKGGGAA